MISLAWLRYAAFLLLLIVTTSLMISLPVQAAADYETLEWTDLMPPMDLAALENQVIDHGQIPDSTSESDWNSERDIVGAEIDSWSSSQDSFQEDAYQSALRSTRTVDAFSGKEVKLAGFIVPLEFDDEMTITQFFLVPYFGACIHLPAPPPNQMILVDYAEGLKLDALYTPFWISGTLSIQIIENEMGTSAYAMDMHTVEVYEY